MDEMTTDTPKEKDGAASSTTTVPADPVDDVVTTGTCVVPFEVASGDHIRVDFGDFGSVEASATD